MGGGFTELRPNQRWATLVNIRKRDATVQKFDKNKPKSSLVRAGAEEGEASKITDSMAKRAKGWDAD